MSPFWEKVWQNFDKILVAFVFESVLIAALFIHTRPGMDEGTLDWARTLSTSIFSVLAGLVGGVAIGRTIAKNGTVTNPKPPSPIEPTKEG